MLFIMDCKFLYLLFIVHSVYSLEIKECSNEVTKIKTVCKKVENYEMDEPPQPHPNAIDLEINILDIVDLDWTANTITLFIQLWTFWKDPRVTITDYIDEDEIKEEG